MDTNSGTPRCERRWSEGCAHMAHTGYGDAHKCGGARFHDAACVCYCGAVRPSPDEAYWNALHMCDSPPDDFTPHAWLAATKALCEAFGQALLDAGYVKADFGPPPPSPVRYVIVSPKGMGYMPCRCGHDQASHNQLKFNCLATTDGTHATRCDCKVYFSAGLP